MKLQSHHSTKNENTPIAVQQRFVQHVSKTCHPPKGLKLAIFMILSIENMSQTKCYFFRTKFTFGQTCSFLLSSNCWWMLSIRNVLYCNKVVPLVVMFLSIFRSSFAFSLVTHHFSLWFRFVFTMLPNSSSYIMMLHYFWNMFASPALRMVFSCIHNCSRCIPSVLLWNHVILHHASVLFLKLPYFSVFSLRCIIFVRSLLTCSLCVLTFGACS